MSIIIEDTVEFLKSVPPFQFLDTDTLGAVAASARLEFYPKGRLILSEGGRPSETLGVIKKGGVKVTVATEGEGDITIDYRGEGDSYGFISLISSDKSRYNVIAVEDTVCYEIGRDAVLHLMDTNPAFSEYYVKSFLIRTIDRTFQEMQGRMPSYCGGDRALFTTPVRDLLSKAPLSLPASVSIREAAGAMASNNISSLVVTGVDGSPVGIVTDRDLRAKVVAKGRDAEGPVFGIMSSALVRIDGSDYCFDALLKMIRYGIHHLLVVDGGKLAGVVTNHDLMVLQGISPVTVVKDIESRQTVDELAGASGKINGIISLLLKEGARASNITRIITEMNDRLVRRVIEITLRKHGPAPVPFCWMAYGSEGRREQTFRTDQDNAIIYEDPEGDAHARRCDEYFGAFAKDVNDALERCGFAACPAGYMASNPKWRGPYRAWQRYFRDWIYNPTPDAVLSSLIFFDVRPVYGDASLVERLREKVFAMLRDQEVFLGFMAGAIIRNRPPMGFFNNFVVEKSGEHRDMLNIKVKGVTPIVDSLRLFALEKGVAETSTLERIAVLSESHSTVRAYAEELKQSFEFMNLLRIHSQVEMMESGKAPDNFVDPRKLSGLEKKTMKEAFRLISHVQSNIVERYKSMVW